MPDAYEMTDSERETLPKRIKLLSKEVEEEIMVGIDYLDKRMAHMYPGVVGFFVNPIVRMFYAVVGKEAAHKRARGQLAITMLAAVEAISMGIEAATKKHVDVYMETDELCARAVKDHPAYPKLKKMMTRLFEIRIGLLKDMLVHEWDTYGEGLRKFTDRKKVESVIGEWFDLIDDGIDFLAASKGLIEVPSMVRDEVYKIAKESFGISRKSYLAKVIRGYEGTE